MNWKTVWNIWLEIADDVVKWIACIVLMILVWLLATGFSNYHFEKKYYEQKAIQGY